RLARNTRKIATQPIRAGNLTCVRASTSSQSRNVVLPHDVLLLCDFEDDSGGSHADEGISVRQGLSAGDVDGTENPGIGRGITPQGPIRPVLLVRTERIATVRVDRQYDFLDARVHAAWARITVVENEQVSGSGKTLGNPVGVVLSVESLIRRRPG